MGDNFSLRKSACWDGNGKKESGAWPSWDDARPKTVEKYNHQNGKCAWNQSQEWIALEDGNTITGNGVWHETKDGKAKKETHKGGSRKSACWDRHEDGNDKKESGGWPSWDGASSKTIELYADPKYEKTSWIQSQGWASSEADTTMACKNGWNDFEDVNAKKDLSECSDAIYLDGNNGWRQSNPKTNMVNKGSLRKSACWDRSADGNGKKESGEWPSWNVARSKAVGKYNNHQKRGVWNQAQDLITLDDGTAITVKGGWNELEDNKAKEETSEGGLRKSACWERHEDDNDKKESGGWPSWDGASSMTIGLCTDPKNGKGSLNQPRGCNSEDANAKRKLSEGSETFYLDGIDGRREYDPKINIGDRCNLRKSTSWNSATDDIWKESGWQPSWNGARFNSFGKYTSRQNGKGNLNQSQGWNASKDGTAIEGASTDYRDSPRWPSQRGSQFRRGIGNAFGQYSDRDVEGFRDNKKARYPRNDRWINSENIWKQRNHLKDTLTPRQESRFYGVKESTFSRNDSSYLGRNHENTGMVSSWNGLMIPNATATDQLRQSHTMIDNVGFRGETIKSTATSPKQNADQGVRNSQHWKTQPKYYISQQTPQNTGSLSDNQNDHNPDSAIQFGQNMQVNSQLSSRPIRSNSKVEVQNHEQQQAMPMGELFRKKDDTCEASTALDLNVFPFTSLSSFDPVGRAFIQVNEESSSSNLRSRFSPASIKSSKTSEEIKSNSTKLVSIDKNLNQSFLDPSHRDPLVDKGIRMFKATLAEFVKNTIKPIWKEGGLSKEAHKTVVKKVVDKVTGVLGSNIPQTQEMIDQYMSFADAKLHKLTQDYLEMFINT